MLLAVTDSRFVSSMFELQIRLPNWLDSNRHYQIIRLIRFVTNMAYNLGVPKLLRFKRMWAAVEQGDFDAAAKHALGLIHSWAKQVKGQIETSY